MILISLKFTRGNIEAEKDNPQGDLVWGGLQDSDGEKYADIFEPWVSEHCKDNLSDYVSCNSYCSLHQLSPVVFCVNLELEKELGIKIESYEDLLKKYCMTFTDFDDNYDVLEGKGNQAKFMQTLKTSIQKIRHFRNVIEKAKKSYQATHESHLLLISMISLFEKEALKDYCQDNEDKLIFFNTKNVQLCKTISEVQENIANPYDKLYDAIAGDYLDTEALMEGIESINSLQEQYDGLLKKQNSAATTITELQAGKTNIKSIFSFKSREQEIDAMMEEKQKLDTDIQNLGQIIRICCFNMDQEIKEFKTVNLESYYNELTKLEATLSENNKILNGLWNSIINDENIKAVNLE